ncbi:MAG: hypothetical protein JW922_07010 [Paludibacteraceae bacterium]|nr:hypothetical protein [Paludibacteraceae bacterium]
MAVRAGVLDTLFRSLNPVIATPSTRPLGRILPTEWWVTLIINYVTNRKSSSCRNNETALPQAVVVACGV